jgi:hypothetical protein
MEFCRKQQIKYTKGIAKGLLPFLIENSKSLLPWHITPFGGVYVCFTPKSEIVWNKDSVDLSNFFYSAYQDFGFKYKDTATLQESPFYIKKYPNDGQTKINIHSKELCNSSHHIKFEPVKEAMYDGYHKHKAMVGELFETNNYNEGGKQTKMIVSAYKIFVFQKTTKKLAKQKSEAVISQIYNVTSNSKVGIDLDPVFKISETDRFVVKDNFSESSKP